MAVRVEQELVVRVGGEVQPWVPTTMTRDGKKYIRLHLKDLNLVRFLGLEQRKRKEAPGIDQLSVLRDVASRQWCADITRTSGGAFADEDNSSDVLPNMQGVDLPIHVDVKVHGLDQPMRMLFSLDSRIAVAVECTLENLQFVKDVGKNGIPGIDTNTAKVEKKGMKRKRAELHERVVPPDGVSSPMRWCGNRDA